MNENPIPKLEKEKGYVPADSIYLLFIMLLG
jgi:hypothetical protein